MRLTDTLLLAALLSLLVFDVANGTQLIPAPPQPTQPPTFGLLIGEDDYEEEEVIQHFDAHRRMMHKRSPSPAAAKKSTSTKKKSTSTKRKSTSTIKKSSSMKKSTSTANVLASTKKTTMSLRRSTTSSKPTTTSRSTTSSRSTSSSRSTTSSLTRSTTSSSSSTRSTTSSSSTRSSTTSSSTTNRAVTTTSSSSTTSTTTSAATPTAKPTYTLIDKFKGSKFYDNFYFFTAGDPTNGDIDYVGRAEASSLGLIGMRSSQVYMGYATTRIHSPVTTSSSTFTTTTSVAPTSVPTDTFSSSSTTTTMSTSTTISIPDFKAVRVSTYNSYTSGIFVLDASHMPVGCGLWPAFWTVPANPAGSWPKGGEIDILEGVHDYSYNTASIHTIRGCTVNASEVVQYGDYTLADPKLATNCASFNTDNQGCGVRSNKHADYGVAYNNNNGGVHVMVWDETTGIKVWFFQRSTVPADLNADTPDPTLWGTPTSSWPATSCDPVKFFFNHIVVFTNTICGDWAGADAVWSNAFGAYGQTQSCKSKTGFKTCKEYMAANPDMSQAYWLINFVKVFQVQRKA